MNSKQIKGIAVVSIADGTKLGTVDQVYLDPNDLRVAGFTVHPSGGGFLSGHRHDGLIEIADIHSLGPDALTLTDASVVKERAGRSEDTGLITIDELIKRKVVTETGAYVGQVVAVDFTGTDFALGYVEVSPGLLKSNKHFTPAQITSFGGDVMIVTDASIAEPTEVDEIEVR